MNNLVTFFRDIVVIIIACVQYLTLPDWLDGS